MKWTAEDDAKLVELHAEGVLYDAIAARMGRTTSAIRNRVLVLRKAGRIGQRKRGPKPGFRRTPEPEPDAALAAVKHQRATAEEINQAAFALLAAATAEARPA